MSQEFLADGEGNGMSREPHQATGWRLLAQSGLLPQFAVLCFAIWLHAANSMLAATTLPSAVDELGGAHLIAWAFTLYQLGSILAGAAAGLLARKIGLREGLAGAALCVWALAVLCVQWRPLCKPFWLAGSCKGQGAGCCWRCLTLL